MPFREVAAQSDSLQLRDLPKHPGQAHIFSWETPSQWQMIARVLGPAYFSPECDFYCGQSALELPTGMRRHSPPCITAGGSSSLCLRTQISAEVCLPTLAPFPFSFTGGTPISLITTNSIWACASQRTQTN